ncbi:MAG: DMT family transporter [Bacteroidetes bacterium]|nr:DMT family transporter [Bacteroidota bacterium]
MGHRGPVRRGGVAMLGAVVLFTSANGCVKELSHLGTCQLVFLRSTVSLLLCVAFLRWRGIPVLGYNRTWLVVRGLAGMVALAGFFHTLRHIPLASATVIQYCSPVFTVVLALMFLKERVHKAQWLFLGLALVGIVMVKGFDPRVTWGMWGLGMTSACFSAVAYLATMKCRDSDHPVGVVVWFHMLAVPIMGLLSVGDWVPMVGTDWVLALAIGVLSIVAQVMMTVALHNEDAGTVMPFKYLGAVLALIVGWWGYGEHMSMVSLVGMALVVASIVANTVLKARIKGLPAA